MKGETHESVGVHDLFLNRPSVRLIRLVIRRRGSMGLCSRGTRAPGAGTTVVTSASSTTGSSGLVGRRVNFLLAFRMGIGVVGAVLPIHVLSFLNLRPTTGTGAATLIQAVGVIGTLDHDMWMSILGRELLLVIQKKDDPIQLCGGGMPG